MPKQTTLIHSLTKKVRTLANVIVAAGVGFWSVRNLDRNIPMLYRVALVPQGQHLINRRFQSTDWNHDTRPQVPQARPEWQARRGRHFNIIYI